MRTIAIVNEKGGTGKTTTAVNLAAALGEAGKSILLVDLDGQAATSRWLGVQDDSRFADALWRGTGLEPLRDIMSNVALAPGHGKLDAVAHDLRPTQGGQLRKLLNEQNSFDYILIDCPPSLGNRLIGNALLAAGEAIVPVETSILALDGLKILLTTLEDIREGFDHRIELTGVLACRYDPRTRLSRLVLEELRRALPGKVFQTVIRENVRMRECPASGTSILAYAPNSHAAEDYRALAKELIAMHEAADANPAAAESPTNLRTVAAMDHWKQIAPLLQRRGPKAVTEEIPEPAQAPQSPDTVTDQPAPAATDAPPIEAPAPPEAPATVEAPVESSFLPLQPVVAEEQTATESDADHSAALALEEVIRRLKETQTEETLSADEADLVSEMPSPAVIAAIQEEAESLQQDATLPAVEQPPVPQATGEPQLVIQTETEPLPVIQVDTDQPTPIPDAATVAEQEAPEEPPPQTAATAPPAESEAPNIDDLIWRIDNSDSAKPQDRDKANTPDGQADDYPALKEMLTKMGAFPSPHESTTNQPQKKNQGWRRFLSKIVTGD